MIAQGQRLKKLAQEIHGFQKPENDQDQNHRHYLAEASQFLRQVDDPLDVLRFLDKLLRSPFTKRQKQKRALTDIGQWLFKQLIRAPHIDKNDLTYDLAWLQRLAVIRSAEAMGKSSGSTSATPAKYQPTDFQREIEAVEKRRQKLLSEISANRKNPIPRPKKRVAPSRLPTRLEVVFADIKAARDARKNAIKREKQGKSKKTNWLKLQPVDDLFSTLATGLSCTFETKGCDTIFAEMAEKGGAVRSFWVNGLRKDGDRLIVENITLD